MKKIRGYINGKLFIESDNLQLVKYSLEQEIKYNEAKEAMYYLNGCIASNWYFENGQWINR